MYSPWFRGGIWDRLHLGIIIPGLLTYLLRLIRGFYKFINLFQELYYERLLFQCYYYGVN